MLDFGFYNMDCMDGMAQFPDGYFDLAIVDPPYGIKINMNMGRKKGEPKKHAVKDWDNGIPSQKYFDELFRVSKNQIIWGGETIFRCHSQSLGCFGTKKCRKACHLRTASLRGRHLTKH